MTALDELFALIEEAGLEPRLDMSNWCAPRRWTAVENIPESVWDAATHGPVTIVDAQGRPVGMVVRMARGAEEETG